MTMPGRAVPALQAVVLHERLLHRVQRAVGVGHALDRADVLAVGLHGEHGAALDRFTVQMDRARTARRGVAADVRAGETGLLTDEVHEQRARLDIVRMRRSVDGDGDFHRIPHVARVRTGDLDHIMPHPHAWHLHADVTDDGQETMVVKSLTARKIRNPMITRPKIV